MQVPRGDLDGDDAGLAKAAEGHFGDETLFGGADGLPFAEVLLLEVGQRFGLSVRSANELERIP